MDDTEQLRRMITKVSALEAAIEGLLAAHANLHGPDSLQELVNLMRILPQRLPTGLTEAEDQLRKDQRWYLEELCANGQRAQSALPNKRSFWDTPQS